MYCSKCGTQVPDGAAFCASCGQPQIATAPPAPGVPAAPLAAAPIRPVSALSPSIYAGFWLRFVAYVIDTILSGIVFGVLLLMGIAVVGFSSLKNVIQGSESPDEFFAPEVIGIIFLIAGVFLVMHWIYFAWMESSATQGTLGKMALGLIVTDLDGNRISFARASGRFFAKIITGLIPLFIGYILAGITEKKQALHDMIASCLVLRKT
jgi:uncharacterized RDD family membrane protein YckC